MLRMLVAQFMPSLMRHVIVLRELDFVLWALTKVWHLSDTCVVRLLHVRQALELGGSGSGSRLQLSKGVHFGALLERFSEGEGSDDVPLAERARRGKGKAIARSENEDDDVGEGDQELQ